MFLSRLKWKPLFPSIADKLSKSHIHAADRRSLAFGYLQTVGQFAEEICGCPRPNSRVFLKRYIWYAAKGLKLSDFLKKNDHILEDIIKISRMECPVIIYNKKMGPVSESSPFKIVASTKKLRAFFNQPEPSTCRSCTKRSRCGKFLLPAEESTANMSDVARNLVGQHQLCKLHLQDPTRFSYLPSAEEILASTRIINTLSEYMRPLRNRTLDKIPVASSIMQTVALKARAKRIQAKKDAEIAEAQLSIPQWLRGEITPTDSVLSDKNLSWKRRWLLRKEREALDDTPAEGEVNYTWVPEPDDALDEFGQKKGSMVGDFVNNTAVADKLLKKDRVVSENYILQNKGFSSPISNFDSVVKSESGASQVRTPSGSIIELPSLDDLLPKPRFLHRNNQRRQSDRSSKKVLEFATAYRAVVNQAIRRRAGASTSSTDKFYVNLNLQAMAAINTHKLNMTKLNNYLKQGNIFDPQSPLNSTLLHKYSREVSKKKKKIISNQLQGRRAAKEFLLKNPYLLPSLSPHAKTLLNLPALFNGEAVTSDSPSTSSDSTKQLVDKSIVASASPIIVNDSTSIVNIVPPEFAPWPPVPASGWSRGNEDGISRLLAAGETNLSKAAASAVALASPGTGVISLKSEVNILDTLALLEDIWAEKAFTVDRTPRFVHPLPFDASHKQESGQVLSPVGGNFVKEKNWGVNEAAKPLSSRSVPLVEDIKSHIFSDSQNLNKEQKLREIVQSEKKDAERRFVKTGALKDLLHQLQSNKASNDNQNGNSLQQPIRHLPSRASPPSYLQDSDLELMETAIESAQSITHSEPIIDPSIAFKGRQTEENIQKNRDLETGIRNTSKIGGDAWKAERDSRRNRSRGKDGEILDESSESALFERYVSLRSQQSKSESTMENREDMKDSLLNRLVQQEHWMFDNTDSQVNHVSQKEFFPSEKFNRRSEDFQGVADASGGNQQMNLIDHPLDFEKDMEMASQSSRHVNFNSREEYKTFIRKYRPSLSSSTQFEDDAANTPFTTDIPKDLKERANELASASSTSRHLLNQESKQLSRSRSELNVKGSQTSYPRFVDVDMGALHKQQRGRLPQIRTKIHHDDRLDELIDKQQPSAVKKSLKNENHVDDWLSSSDSAFSKRVVNTELDKRAESSTLSVRGEEYRKGKTELKKEKKKQQLLIDAKYKNKQSHFDDDDEEQQLKEEALKDFSTDGLMKMRNVRSGEGVEGGGLAIELMMKKKAKEDSEREQKKMRDAGRERMIMQQAEARESALNFIFKSRQQLQQKDNEENLRVASSQGKRAFKPKKD